MKYFPPSRTVEYRLWSPMKFAIINFSSTNNFSPPSHAVEHEMRPHSLRALESMTFEQLMESEVHGSGFPHQMTLNLQHLPAPVPLSQPRSRLSGREYPAGQAVHESRFNQRPSYEQLLALDHNNVPRGINRQVQETVLRCHTYQVPSHGTSRASSKSRPHELQCPVCQDDVKVGEKVAVLPCDHAFHKECISPWLERDRTCPTCRREVYPTAVP